LGTYDIKTVRAALLAGEENLRTIRNVGDEKIDALKQAFVQQVPDIPLRLEADPTLAAKLCHTLHQVPLGALDPQNYALHVLRLEGHYGVSVHDIVNTDSVSRWLAERKFAPNPDVEAAAAELGDKARQYADAFQRAKQLMYRLD
jgi:hypothetical protein